MDDKVWVVTAREVAAHRHLLDAINRGDLQPESAREANTQLQATTDALTAAMQAHTG